jgi:DNA-binding CsgD family transcriptional regulator
MRHAPPAHDVDFFVVVGANMAGRIVLTSGTPDEILADLVSNLTARPQVQDGKWCVVRLVASEDPTLCISGVLISPLLPLNAKQLQESFHLSKSQARIALLVAARLTNTEICELLNCRPSTLRSHLAWIFTRMNVERREHVLQKIYEVGLQDKAQHE